MFDHEDDCEKVNYEGGTCTCDLIREYGDRSEEATEAAGLQAMEDHDSPDMDG